jgi:hypothetical protein
MGLKSQLCDCYSVAAPKEANDPLEGMCLSNLIGCNVNDTHFLFEALGHPSYCRWS